MQQRLNGVEPLFSNSCLLFMVESNKFGWGEDVARYSRFQIFFGGAGRKVKNGAGESHG